MRVFATVLSLSLFCSLGLIEPVHAQQKPAQKSRPLEGSPNIDAPRFSSFDDFIAAQAHNATHDLKTRATVVDTAVIEWTPISRQHVAEATSAGKAAKRFGIEYIEHGDSGTIRWFKGRLRAPGKAAVTIQSTASGRETVTRAALDILQANRSLLRIDNPMEEFTSLHTEIDELGLAHARFEQRYQGVPVWGRDLYVHFDQKGEVYALNGVYEPTPAGLSTRPAISSEAAEARVVADLQASERWAPLDDATAEMLGMDSVERTLVIYPTADRGMKLAYEISLHPNFLEYYTYLIDAQSGEVLNRIARHCSAIHDPNPPPAEPVTLNLPKPAAGTFTDAQGTDLNGQNQNFRVYQDDNGTFLQLWDLDNLNTTNLKLPVPDVGGSVILSANSADLNEQTQLFGVTSNDNTWTNASSVSAHVGAKTLYDYFKNTFGRKAIDDKDQSIISVIHVAQGGQPMDNAFWNGRVMAYGDGKDISKPWAGAVDLTGHEMTHGVVQSTAGLVYQFQSGALNESFADVFAVLLDPEDFLLFEDIALPTFGPAFRDLLNPDNAQLRQPQPASMAQYANLTAEQDNGGVHINSGIPNRAAALIMQNIGHDKTAQIYYRALTMYLTRNSQFGDARNAVVQAATDLHGAGSAEVQAAEAAFDAVGITTGTGTGGDEGNDIPPQTGGQSLISFLLDDGSIGLIDMTDPSNVQTGVFQSEAAVARVNLDTGDLAQLSSARNGANIWFVNDALQLAFIDVATGQVSVFTDLMLGDEADIWNVSISPDENYAAIVSAYENDPNLYIFDGSDVGIIELKPESTQEGIFIETVQFPDVVSWSPNPQVPRIAFDALNVLPLISGGEEAYWNLYEIDFSVQRIYELVPAQGGGVSVANVTYSNSDPDVIAFNVFDDEGNVDIFIANYATGDIFPIETTNAGLNNAWRPTFSPDDGLLAFSNTLTNQIAFYDGQQFSTLDYEVRLHNPNWFVSGGSGGSQNQAPTAAISASSGGGIAPIEITFDASGSSDPEGGALSYRWEFGDGSTSGGITASHTYSAAGTFTVTLTVTDSGGLSGQASGTVTIEAAGGVPIETGSELPEKVALRQNYPNPFNPTTRLQFDLPAASHVSLQVVDLLGRTVRTVVDEVRMAGSHEVVFDAQNLPSGIYLMRLEAGNEVRVRQMTLLR